jgi:catechol 2,3-dioxygenase-like lactoylglutathione lyase family enzyme
MSTKITTSGVHHIRLIVTDPVRSRDFYTSLLNFTVAAELPPGFVLSNGNILLGMTSPWDPSQAIPNDHFSPNRVGLDHLSFGVANRAELLKAEALFEERGVQHGEVRDLPPFGITILSFNDPDGIQCELTAPLEQGD